MIDLVNLYSCSTGPCPYVLCLRMFGILAHLYIIVTVVEGVLAMLHVLRDLYGGTMLAMMHGLAWLVIEST